jgi:hypothetical protein
MNLGKFGRRKRLKRLIPFHRLPEAQRNLFQSLKHREPSLWEEQTPPPSPQYQSESDEGDNNYYERNPFLPNNLEIDPSNFRDNTMSAMHTSISDSILASNTNFEYDVHDNEGSNPLDNSNHQNTQDDSNRQDYIPPGIKVNSRQSLIGLDGRPRSSSSS